VRIYNNQVRTNRQSIIASINNLESRSYSFISTNNQNELRNSVQILNSSYEKLESNFDYSNNEFNNELILGLPEQEINNSVLLYNSLTGRDEDDDQKENDIQQTLIEQQLSQVSEDLDSRWRGALFSLNPSNPDAARHFCTSVREILVKILDIKAPDNDLINNFPNCELTAQGKPTRKAKVLYLLNRNNLNYSSLENFVNNDIDDVLKLFRALNDGTHGNAGKFGIPQLLKLKKRVEDSIMFLTSII
jgi:hypothetical protein